MTNQLRSSLSQWRLQAGQRAPFVWGLRNATIDKQSTIIQAGWLIAPARAELCDWERFRLPIRVHSEPACVARQEVMDDDLLSIDVAETTAPPSASTRRLRLPHVGLVLLRLLIFVVMIWCSGLFRLRLEFGNLARNPLSLQTLPLETFGPTCSTPILLRPLLLMYEGHLCVVRWRIPLAP